MLLDENGVKEYIFSFIQGVDNYTLITMHYERHSSIYKIADLDGGVITNNLQEEYIVDHLCTFGTSDLPIPVKEDYKFVGWSTSKGGKIYNSEDKVLSEELSYDLYANYVIDYEMVEFNANCGKFNNDSDTITIKYRLLEIITPEELPFKENHKLLGWSLTPNGSIIDMSKCECVQGLKLYAVWEDVTLRIVTYILSNDAIFNEISGFTISSDKKRAQTTIVKDSNNIIPIPNDLEEYDFMGWSKTINCSILSIALVNEYLQECAYGKVDAYLYLVFEKNYEMVELNANGGTFLSSLDKKNVKSKLGEIVNISEEPTRTNHKFLGWSKVVNGEVIDESEIISTKGLVLYAKWLDVTPKVITLNANQGVFADGTNQMLLSVNYPYYFSIDVVPTMNISGETWVFSHWVNSDGLTIDSYYLVSEGEDIYAKYLRTDVSIVFSNNCLGYDDLSEKLILNYGNITYKNTDNSEPIIVYASSNGVINYPIYDKDFNIQEGYIETFIVLSKFLTEEGKRVLSDSKARMFSLNDDSYYEINTILKTDMLNSSDSDLVINVGIVPEKVYYTVSYVLTLGSANFNSQLGFELSADRKTVITNIDDNNVLPIVPLQEDFDFLGWSTEENGNVISSSEINNYLLSCYNNKQNAILYSKFKQNYENVVVDANGGTFINNQVKEYLKVKLGEVITGITEPTRENHEFLGWTTEENGQIIDVNTLVSVEGLVIYARWLDVTPRKLVLNAKEGSFIDNTLTKELIVEYPYNLINFSTPIKTVDNEDWSFGYWVNEEGKRVDDNYLVSENEIFYAIYLKTLVEVKFSEYGYSFDENTQQVILDNLIISIPGSNEYGELVVNGNISSKITIPSYTNPYTIPSGYKEVLLINGYGLSDYGKEVIISNGGYCYVTDQNELVYELVTDLTLDMLSFEGGENYLITVGIVPENGPEERVRFDNYLFFENNRFGIIDSDYDHYIKYNDLDFSETLFSSLQNSTVVIPSYIADINPNNDEKFIFVINEEYLTKYGISMLKEANAREYIFTSEGYNKFYEVSISITKEMLNMYLQPTFNLVIVSKEYNGIDAIVLNKVLLVGDEQNISRDYKHLVEYANASSSTAIESYFKYSNGEFIVPQHAFTPDYSIPSGYKVIFVVRMQDLNEDTINYLESQNVPKYYLDEGGRYTYYELNFTLNKNMVKDGKAASVSLSVVR